MQAVLAPATGRDAALCDVIRQQLLNGISVLAMESALQAGHLNGRLHMDQQVQHALEHDSLIDITTRGRKSGQPHRIEIRFHNIEGHLYITGRPPRPRDWYANLLAHPEFTFHLKQSVRADLPAKATPILDEAGRRAILAAIHQKLGRYQDVEAWVASSPLVAVELLFE